MIPGISKPDGRKKTLSLFQSAQDIAGAVLMADKNNVQYDKYLNQYFNTGNKLQSLELAYNWVISKIHYNAERTTQTVKTIPRILADKEGDCKHFSILMASIARSLGFPYKFRLTSYTSSIDPTHIYILVKYSGKWIPVDATYKAFGIEKTFTHGYDYEPLTNINMLNYLSDNTGQVGRKSKAERQKARAERKKKRKERKQERKEGKRPKLVAKIALAPARNAYLGLVRINFLKSADKHFKAEQVNPAGARRKWTKFGGKYDALQDVFMSGKKINAITLDEVLNGVNAAPAIPALLAAATPIIIVMSQFFKESGILDAKEAEDYNLAIDKGKEELSKNPDFDKDITYSDLADNQTGIVGKDKEEPGDTDNTILYVGLGVAALALLSGKNN